MFIHPSELVPFSDHVLHRPNKSSQSDGQSQKGNQPCPQKHLSQNSPLPLQTRKSALLSSRPVRTKQQHTSIINWGRLSLPCEAPIWETTGVETAEELKCSNEIDEYLIEQEAVFGSTEILDRTKNYGGLCCQLERIKPSVRHYPNPCWTPSNANYIYI